MASSNSLSEHELNQIKAAADWLGNHAQKLNFAYVKSDMFRHASNLWYIANDHTFPPTPTKGENDGNHSKED